MCTCGIDIATQQATPATQSRAWAWFRLRPNGRVDGAALLARRAGAATAAGGRGRSSMASSGIVTAQKMPSPM